MVSDKEEKKNKDWVYSSVVEHLPGMGEVLGLILALEE